MSKEQTPPTTWALGYLAELQAEAAGGYHRDLRAWVDDTSSVARALRTLADRQDAALSLDRTTLTDDENRAVHAAFERDKWAGEWNSLPTAIDRVLTARQDGTETGLRQRATALADKWDADLQREFGVGSDYTHHHSRELRDVIPGCDTEAAER